MSSDNTTVDISIGDELEDLTRNFDMIMTNEEKRMSLEQFFTYMYKTIQSNKFQNIIRSKQQPKT